MRNEIIEFLATELDCHSSYLKETSVKVVKNTCEDKSSILAPNNSLVIVANDQAVICSCCERYYSICVQALADLSHQEFFEASNLSFLSELVRGDNLLLSGPYYVLLGPTQVNAQNKPLHNDIKVKTEKVNVEKLYEYEGFGNALKYEVNEKYNNSLAVTAWSGDELVGVATACAEHEKLWSVGIEVLPKWQRKRIGKTILTELTRLILAEGKIPFYSVSIANIPSLKLALSVGYELAWITVYTV